MGRSCHASIDFLPTQTVHVSHRNQSYQSTWTPWPLPVPLLKTSMSDFWTCVVSIQPCWYIPHPRILATVQSLSNNPHASPLHPPTFPHPAPFFHYHKSRRSFYPAPPRFLLLTLCIRVCFEKSPSPPSIEASVALPSTFLVKSGDSCPPLAARVRRPLNWGYLTSPCKS